MLRGSAPGGAQQAYQLVFSLTLAADWVWADLHGQSMGNALSTLANLCRGLLPVQVLKKAAEKKELVQVALNTHGTRAVQKLIETLTTREQVSSLDLCCCHGEALHVNAPEVPLPNLSRLMKLCLHAGAVLLSVQDNVLHS